MALTLHDPTAAAVAASGLNLTVPAGVQSGDLRVWHITIAASITFGATPAGYVKVSDEVITGAGRVGVLTRILQPGDTTGVLNFSASTNASAVVVTLRGSYDPTTPITVLNTGSSVAATSIVAPSVTPDRTGTLLTYHRIARASGASTTTWTSLPAGMIEQAWARSTASAGYVVTGLAQALAAGDVGVTTGDRTAVASGSGPWVASTLLVRETPARTGDHFHVLA